MRARPTVLAALQWACCVSSLLALSCAEPGVDTASGDAAAPAEVLELPDLDGLELEALFQQAVLDALTVDASAAWAGHRTSLERRSEGCPDFYIGVPEVEGTNADPEDPGLSWYDHCAGASAGSADFDGVAYWETTLAAEGDAALGDEVWVEASRTLDGDALVSDGAAAYFSFDGTATDALYTVTAAATEDEAAYSRWVWTSEVAGSVQGTDALPAGTTFAGGWRTDLYLYATGGDVSTLEMRGNVYLYGDLFADRFDSMAMDLSLLGEGAAGPDDCALEPYGWIGLRDPDAWWYDLVFLPRYDDDATDTEYGNAPYGECDGCGTLYIRGLEVTEVGQVCVDLSAVWAAAEARVPTAADYVLSLRDLEGP